MQYFESKQSNICNSNNTELEGISELYTLKVNFQNHMMELLTNLDVPIEYHS